MDGKDKEERRGKRRGGREILDNFLCLQVTNLSLP